MRVTQAYASTSHLRAFFSGSAPSFEQMGMAIQELIRKDLDDVDDDADSSFGLSAEHQLLMSWAWISIKVKTLGYYFYVLSNKLCQF